MEILLNVTAGIFVAYFACLILFGTRISSHRHPKVEHTFDSNLTDEVGTYTRSVNTADGLPKDGGSFIDITLTDENLAGLPRLLYKAGCFLAIVSVFLQVVPGVFSA